MTDKLPPQNIEAESNLLASCLLDSDALAKIVDILTPEKFYVSAHQQIYRAILELYRQNQPTDLLTVTSWLHDHKLLTKVGGRSQLSKLVDRKVSTVNIDHTALLVLAQYQRRQLIKVGNEILELGYDVTKEIKEVLEQSESKIFNLTSLAADKFKPQVISDCLMSVLQEFKQGYTPGLTTGLTDLDTLIGGLNKQDLIVIAARASMGKTWLSCHLANSIAVQQLPVVFFSAEMSKSQLTKRFLAMHSGIDSSRLIRNQIYRDEIDNLKQALCTLLKLPIIIDDTPALYLNPSKICSVLRRVKSSQGNLGIVVIDYIQKLGDRSAANRAQVVGKFSGAFKDIARII
ncbi:MAG: DnaB-like helicase C-terminal domain-containing protein [Scytonema sp. PMC 1069.18]|nr:DnaB-like helicase C-terminal domain-containing protein [Scytonema sp. PMC 1069.18]MEC4886547.1 DnaB-like helicase C-terminal domain-containing protein [Scytonema sp. PMC 1070.18]